MSSGTQFVGASNGHVIPVPQVTEDLGLLSVDFAPLDIHPFRIPILDANDKRRFCRAGYSGSGDKKCGLRSADRPDHVWKHSGG